MRIIQNLVVLFGAVAFGLGAGGLGAFAAMSCVFPQPRGESFGGAGVWIVAILGGAVAGALFGFGVALGWIRRRGGEAWNPFAWIGAGLGLVGGVTLCLGPLGHFYAWFWVICAAFVLPLCATIGGLPGGNRGNALRAAMRGSIANRSNAKRAMLRSDKQPLPRGKSRLRERRP